MICTVEYVYDIYVYDDTKYSKLQLELKYLLLYQQNETVGMRKCSKFRLRLPVL